MHSTNSSIRHGLKEATTKEHASLEACIGPLHTQSAYNEYAAGLHAFRTGVEHWLSGRAPAASWKPHQIAGTLHQDLNDLEISPLPISIPEWDQADEAFAMGVHYVLEGSALGARVLCKHVAPLGLHRGYGARHLWAQAEQSDWRGFLIHLQTSAHRFEQQPLIAGAQAAFTAAAGAMERARCA